MRKRYRHRYGLGKHKRCVCKPNKTGESRKMTDKELMVLKEFEEEKTYLTRK
jgi:hypothetical protein